MNVIYIDDDASNRLVVRDMLAVAGLGMAEAADARTGLHMLDGGRYDLAIVDLRMPDMNGLTAIRCLRGGSGASRQVPILVVTAELSDGVRQLCQAAGAGLCLRKPIRMDTLFDAVVALVPRLAQGVVLG